MKAAAALLVAAALGAGCATLPPDGRIVEVASGREVSRAELLATLRGADTVLLGELHDNAEHHRLRGGLIAALGPVPVVAEHLTLGQSVRFGPDLLASLQAAGFEPRGWDWPIHEPLFAAVQRTGAPLAGGNLPRDTVRRIAREGAAALPADVAALIAAAPLPPAAEAALDSDLVQGHCGQLPAARVPAMRTAQRSRDAAMALALQAAPAKPAVLLAGNGHVRTDYGVPQLLAAAQPGRRHVAVGFGEAGDAWAQAPYTYLWITGRAEREDPCKAMQRARP